MARPTALVMQPAPELRRPLQAPVRHPRAQRHRAVDLDRVEPGHAVQAHHVPREELAAANLDEEVGPPGEEARLGAVPRAERDGLAHRRGLVVLEAHGRVTSLARTAGIMLLPILANAP